MCVWYRERTMCTFLYKLVSASTVVTKIVDDIR